jgi:hypothetical protein
MRKLLLATTVAALLVPLPATADDEVTLVVGRLEYFDAVKLSWQFVRVHNNTAKPLDIEVKCGFSTKGELVEWTSTRIQHVEPSHNGFGHLVVHGKPDRAQCRVRVPLLENCKRLPLLTACR